MGNVTFDAAATTLATSVTTLSRSLTIGDFPNRIVIAIVSNRASSNDILTGVTFAGLPMTRIATIAGGTHRMWLYAMVNPPVGTNNCVATYNTTGDIFFGVSSYYNAKQSSPINAFNTGYTASSNGLSIAVTTTLPNCMIAGGFREGGGDQYTGVKAGTTYRAGGGNTVMVDSGSPVAAVGAYSIGINVNAGNMTIGAACAILPAPPTPGQPVTFDNGLSLA